MKMTAFNKGWLYACVVILVLSSAIRYLTGNYQFQIEARWQQDAVQRKVAEYYLDENYERQWRWTVPNNYVEAE